MKAGFHAKKQNPNCLVYEALHLVGVAGFEPAATRPPDVYSNRTELHPDSGGDSLSVKI